MQVLTVTEINAYLRAMLDSDEVAGDIWVRGEVSNFRQASSGHCYFRLKEGSSLLKGVMWRRQAESLSALPTDGDEVLAHGRISFYEGGGDVQLYVDMFHPAGIGLLHAQFEALKARLEAEGLFDEGRKRPLPALPRRIGVVTSAQGAALRDILNILARRCPLVEVLIAPCMVQGAQAAATIVEALSALYALHNTPLDLIILARGGGSVEDLWCFNEESVARAVFANPLPLIAGVGHETDTTMVDYVADVRAPTPSAAAELAVPDHSALLHDVRQQQERLDAAVVYSLDTHRQNLDTTLHTLRRHAPQARISHSRQQVDEMLRRATSQAQHQVALRRARLQGGTMQLVALNPRATLQRGYAIIQRADDDAVVTRAEQTQPGSRLSVMLHSGTLEVDVVRSEEKQ